MENYTGIMENEYSAAVDYAAANLSQALVQNADDMQGRRPDMMEMKHPGAPEEYVQRGTIIASNLREELSEFASTIGQEEAINAPPLLPQEATESMPPPTGESCHEPTDTVAPSQNEEESHQQNNTIPAGEQEEEVEENIQNEEAQVSGEVAEEETTVEGEEAAAAVPEGEEEEAHSSKSPEATQEAQNSRAKEEELDKNQCRVCTSKENLVDIFSPFDDSVISDKIQQICRTVKILERDFLPHFICGACVEKLKIALEFKETCENTDRELRQKLKRSKNKVRRNTEFVIIDADVFSDSNSEEKKRTDDEEFHLSDVAGSPSDSDVSFKGTEKPRKYKKRGRPPGPSRRGRRPRNDVVFIAAPGSDAEETPPDTKRKFRGKSLQCQTCSEVFASPASLSKHVCSKNDEVDALQEDPIDDNDDDEDKPLSKRLKSAKKETQHECKFCRQTFRTLQEMKRHKAEEHTGEKPFICRICNKTFKLAQSLNGHLLRHENEEINISCAQCWKYFPNKKELRKHEMVAHAVAFTCDKCKRNFTSQTRLNNHKHQTCPGVVVPKKKQEAEASVVGRDLFKCVAPMTSTYWSDSFSE
ncbi:zinc finger protein weckle-like [Lutzomyia longipalpis]|nr:zinc finger protein weckle-like [Lutzomyia longipalpis]